MPSRLARVENWRDRAHHRPGDRVGNERLQEVALQRVLQRREHRERREQRQHHRHQRHQRDDRREGQAAGGEREAVLAKAPRPASARVVEPGPAPARAAIQRVGDAQRFGHGAGRAKHCWHHKQRWTDARLPRPPSSRRTRALAVGVDARADRPRPRLGAVARADRPRHARGQGAAAAPAAAGLLRDAPLHLPLAEPAGLALRRRRRGARDERARRRRGAGDGRGGCSCARLLLRRLRALHVRARAMRGRRPRRPPAHEACADEPARRAARRRRRRQRAASTATSRPYEVDWRKRYRGRALAVVRPGSTAEVAAVVRACAAHGAAIVAQGGNTGLVGGSVPDASGRAGAAVAWRA